jgi:predicted TIM-barrel fold metal-dependent hydrolase
MIVDIHAHYHPDAYCEALSKLYGRTVTNFRPHPDTDNPEHIRTRLQQMEEAGVGLQVLSPAAGHAPYGENEADAVAAARLVNDMNAALVKQEPSKFKSFVSLPLPHIAASVAELKRGLDDLGMIGVNLHISALSRSVAEDEFLPIYEEVNRRKGVIFYHPFGNSILSPMIADYGFGAAVGTSLEDAVIALHLIAKQIPAKYPDITFIIPHLGGPIPMLLPRLNNQFSMQARGLPEPPADTARRFYYDTVGHGSEAALTCAVLAFGAGHILPGSDYPVLLSFESYKQTFDWINHTALSPADKDRILNRNVAEVLGP